jgi:hypothetical protein
VCEEAGGATLIALTIGVLVAVVAFVVLRTQEIVPWVKESAAYNLIASLDRGSLKVVWVTSQIIVSISWNLDISFPSPFAELLGLFSIFSLDFLALECMNDDVQQRYFTTVVLWCALPILMLLVIVAVGYLRVKHNEKDESFDRTSVVNQHVSLALLLTYVVLPPVANKQLQGGVPCIPLSGCKTLL